MKKLSFIIATLLMTFALMITGSPEVHAATTWNSDYIFDPLNVTVNGITITIEEGTNIFTLNGTSNNSNDYNFANMFTANSNGSVLDTTKKYAFHYEYISGSTNGSTKIIQINATPSNDVRTISVSATTYDKNIGFLATYSTATEHRMSVYTGTVVNNLKFKLHVLEVTDHNQDDFVFFSDTTSTTVKGVTVSFPDAYTLVMNGTVSSGTEVDIISKVNTAIVSADEPIMITYEYVSGTTTDSSVILGSGLLSFSIGIEETIRGRITESLSSLIITPGTTGSYSNLTFKLHAQAIEFYSESAPEPWTVTFNSFGGSSVTAQSINDGELATEPTDPTRSGYEFSHWTIQGSPQTVFDFSTPITSDLTLVANWTALPGSEWTVTFETYGGTTISDQTVLNNSLASVPPNPTRAGRTFIEWRVMGTGAPFNFNAPVTQNYDLVAVWESNGEIVYTISFITGSVVSINPIEIEGGESPVAPEDPIRSGYAFVKWVITGTEDEFQFGEPLPESCGEGCSGYVDISLTAVWDDGEIEFVILAFNSNGGSAVQTQVLYDGDLPIVPSYPTRSGYIFGGWYKDIALTQAFSFVGDTVTTDTLLYAKWTPVSGGGDPITDEPAASLNTWVVIGGAAVVLIVAMALTDKKKGKRR